MNRPVTILCTIAAAAAVAAGGGCNKRCKHLAITENGSKTCLEYEPNEGPLLGDDRRPVLGSTPAGARSVNTAPAGPQQSGPPG